ncbi:MAG: archease [Bacillota bacterium]|nr:archease [Bacillota bacterium]
MSPRPPAPDAPAGGPEGHVFLEHTADIRLLAWAQSLPEVIAQALLATASVLFPAPEVARVETRIVTLEAPDPVSLVVQSLNELLFLLDTEGFLLGQVSVEVSGPGLEQQKPARSAPVRATLRLTGDRLGSSQREYRVMAGLKAATYNCARVSYVPERRRWEATLTLDV